MSNNISSSEASARDRRNFFRVSQDVIFDYKLVDAYTAQNSNAGNEYDDARSMGLINELRRLDNDSLQSLRLLAEKNRLLGDYLQSLNNKIDLVARHILFSKDEHTKDRPTTKINLSEEGVAFLSERAIYKGNFLVMRLIFLPRYHPVITFAEIMRCEQKEEKYFVAARFHRLEDKDRQELSRQIMKAQVELKKAIKPNA